MKNKLLKIKELVDELLLEINKEEINKEEANKEEEIKVANDNLSKDFDILKELLFSEKWPEAVFESQIADENSEKDKEERAEGICDILLPPAEGKRFLDFGCGEGHVSKYMAKNSIISVGYDIKKSSNFNWEIKEDNCILTTSFEKVKENGPYDSILLYDILDHVKDDEQVEVLKKAKSVLANNGRIYLRCHPWVGRHGGHAYKKINKAFIHLVFNSRELQALGIADLEYSNKILSPLAAYNKIIDDAKLIKSSEAEVDHQEVEKFFNLHPLVRKRILDVFETSEWNDDGRPVFQMSQCFVDFVLEK